MPLHTRHLVIAALLGATGLRCSAPSDSAVGSVAGALKDVSDCPAGTNVIVAGPTDVQINGTNGDDCIIGNALDNVIRGRGGDDYIAGGMGDDRLLGNSGDDRIFGEQGQDEIRGGGGVDRLYGNGGADDILGGNGVDFIYGGGGADLIGGHTVHEPCRNGGQSGPDDGDVLHGGNGDDIISGHDGDDFIFGDAGNDQLFGGRGADNIDGGPGDDVLCGGASDDVLSGGDGDNVLDPGNGREGALAINAALNDPPLIEGLSILPSSFITTCESASLNATASDVNGDAITITWEVLSTPMGASPALVSAGNAATFTPDLTGRYDLRAVAADIHLATASLTFAIHVSDCP